MESTYCGREPTYCDPDYVAEILDLPGDDMNGLFMFSDQSHPTYNAVCRMILANEDKIDGWTRTSFRVNRVKNQRLTINRYWQDLDGVRWQYYNQGGSYIQLRKNILPWDPEQGDSLEIIRPNMLFPYTDEQKTSRHTPDFDIDYQFGKIYIREPPFGQRANSVVVSYRYGRVDEPVPEGIRRMCGLMTAKQIITQYPWLIRVGMNGDYGQIRQEMTKAYDEDIAELQVAFRATPSVHGAGA